MGIENTRSRLSIAQVDELQAKIAALEGQVAAHKAVIQSIICLATKVASIPHNGRVT